MPAARQSAALGFFFRIILNKISPDLSILTPQLIEVQPFICLFFLSNSNRLNSNYLHLSSISQEFFNFFFNFMLDFFFLPQFLKVKPIKWEFFSSLFSVKI